MIILAIIGLVVMGFILGKLSLHPCDSCPHWDYDIKSGKLSSLETRVFMLEKENERLNYIIDSHGGLKRMFEEEYFAHCRLCEKIFYSRDFKNKEISNLLNNITLSSKEIAKKLEMEVI